MFLKLDIRFAKRQVRAVALVGVLLLQSSSLLALIFRVKLLHRSL
ncbi:hypothetical protein SAMD00023520_00519 [Listeria monocytogenes]|nr:hypothetical protein SAMD00023518_01782 [Listeria monocytogenes]GAT40585.1 hypothetical protein SAMD00023520_00519 [Listeria monocytogenes]